jgi:hypothetical protein
LTTRGHSAEGATASSHLHRVLLATVSSICNSVGGGRWDVAGSIGCAPGCGFDGHSTPLWAAPRRSELQQSSHQPVHSPDWPSPDTQPHRQTPTPSDGPHHRIYRTLPITSRPVDLKAIWAAKETNLFCDVRSSSAYAVHRRAFHQFSEMRAALCHPRSSGAVPPAAIALLSARAAFASGSPAQTPGSLVSGAPAPGSVVPLALPPPASSPPARAAATATPLPPPNLGKQLESTCTDTCVPWIDVWLPASFTNHLVLHVVSLFHNSSRTN